MRNAPRACQASPHCFETKQISALYPSLRKAVRTQVVPLDRARIGTILLENKQVYTKAGMEGKPGESRDGQENLPERLYINIVLR